MEAYKKSAMDLHNNRMMSKPNKILVMGSPCLSNSPSVFMSQCSWPQVNLDSFRRTVDALPNCSKKRCPISQA